jgi:spermidine synthase
MKRRELLDSTQTPEGLRMTLWLHDRDYEIEVDGQSLMSTRAPGSEEALGMMAARELAGNHRPRVLIGGLGLGFTLDAALAALPPGAQVVVVEFFAAIVDWNTKFDFQTTTGQLDDSRVSVVVSDVVDYLRRVKQPFDAILLDVDNGPDAWCLESNRRIYDGAGLLRIQKALNPGGLLAVWSSDPSPAFEKALALAGFAVRSETVRSRGRKGDRHTIFMGRMP